MDPQIQPDFGLMTDRERAGLKKVDPVDSILTFEDTAYISCCGDNDNDKDHDDYHYHNVTSTSAKSNNKKVAVGLVTVITSVMRQNQ